MNPLDRADTPAIPGAARADAADDPHFLAWVHFGDLHASDEDGWQSLRDLRAMVDSLNALGQASVDFAFLPGDNANHGTRRQYRLIERSMSALALPWHVIPGDHDLEPGDLSRFYAGLHARPLPYSVVVGGRRCLFLDIVSAGDGGPDFRLDDAQRDWLRRELAASTQDAARPVVFMHAFPADLAGGADEIAALFAEHRVLCVDTGHTHYNELINDGSVIYSATRSTGQIEEGRVGFSVHAVDGPAVSWRFKEAARPWPFVLVTSPADRRLVPEQQQEPAAPGTEEGLEIRALVLGTDIRAVTLQFDDRPGLPMHPDRHRAGLWTARVADIAGGHHRVQVRAEDASGHRDTDKVTVSISGERAAAAAVARRDHLGHDMHTIGAWLEHGLLGSQLGPNKHGKQW